MRNTLTCLLLGALVALSPACIMLDSDSGRQGYTECGDFLASSPFEKNYCQPGQYCFDATWSDCRPGCTSNQNCAEDQRCVKADGENLGTCQNAKRPATNPR
jgi:hypothetical protein